MAGRFASTSYLNRLINGLLLAALLMTAAGLAVLVQQASVAARDLQQTQAQLPVFDQALSVLEAVVQERAPSNAMLSGYGGDQQRLLAARQRSDERFAKLRQALERCRGCGLSASEAQEIYAQVRAARGQVDQVLQTPLPRSGQAVQVAVNGMLRASERSFVLVDRLLGRLILRTPGLANDLVSAMLSARLRDTSGRLGSLLTVALMENRLPNAREHDLLERTLGRIEQMVELVRTKLERSPNVAERESFAVLQGTYLEQGMGYYRHTLGELGRGRGPGVSGFALEYVPAVDSILTLRDTALELAREEARRLAADARQRLFMTLVAALGILLLLATALLLLKRIVFTPLLDHTQRLIALTDPAADQPRRGVRLRDLFAAFEQLEERLHQAEAVRQERAALIAELEIRAGTDHLTGLPNRRAFEQHLAQPRSGSHSRVILTFDVDHFKSINDTYGHGAGDELLRQLAERCLQLMRESDRIARIGGEEFAVMATVSTLDEGVALAERLRCAIAEQPFQLDETTRLSITASFGVAMAPPGDPWEPERLLAAADAALYRAKHGGRNRSESA